MQKSGELVATMVKQLGGNRVTNNELNFIRNVAEYAADAEAGRRCTDPEQSVANAITATSREYVQRPGNVTLSGFQ